MKAHYRPVQGKRTLDKHATPWHQEVAEAGTILRCEVGSGLHGTSVAKYDDRDEMGLCIEPPDAVIGNKQFEQYEWKTAWERLGGRANRSGPGDLDLTIYSLRKWMRLAMNGNPTVLLMLFAPEDKISKITREGHYLREHMAPHILSRKAGARFVGYLNTQRCSLVSHNGKGRDVTRPELIERYGFDTKFAGHMVRLGFQGRELMQTGRITLPMPAWQREHVIAIRHGEVTMQQALSFAELLQADIAKATATSPLPDEPNRELIDRWLCQAYQWRWRTDDVTGGMP
jgi:uncharacterized protein